VKFSLTPSEPLIVTSARTASIELKSCRMDEMFARFIALASVPPKYISHSLCFHKDPPQSEVEGGAFAEGHWGSSITGEPCLRESGLVPTAGASSALR
jgi:hypothetical protein